MYMIVARRNECEESSFGKTSECHDVESLRHDVEKRSYLEGEWSKFSK